MSQTDKDVDPGRQSSGTDPECLSPAGVVLQVIMSQVKSRLALSNRTTLRSGSCSDEADELTELGDGRRRDRVTGDVRRTPPREARCRLLGIRSYVRACWLADHGQPEVTLSRRRRCPEVLRVVPDATAEWELVRICGGRF
jgi:hypothetical protein